jgi:pimeloyl-ACP methyl ester carboxylesterase
MWFGCPYTGHTGQFDDPEPRIHVTSREISFTRIHWSGRPVRLEYQWVGCTDRGAPLIVFLHEGLGSLAMWRDFPKALCDATHCQGLVYSRPGYGRSTPRATDEAWDVDFMHRQAFEVLPALFAALRVDVAAQPLWLFGHSDGASIALLYAAKHVSHLAGAIVVAPHILVEDISVRSIVKARDVYLQTDFKQRLARHHDDPDSAFWGWNRVWQLPAFRDWSIEAEIESITCPLLAVQGLDDEYGTLEQIRGIARRLKQTELLELAECGHSPHRDQAEKLIAAASEFIARHSRAHRRAAIPGPGE